MSAKRARRGSGSVRKIERVHQDGTKITFYEGRINLGYSTEGKRLQKSVTGKTISEVEQQLHKLANTINEKKYINKNTITVEELMEQWIDLSVRQVPATKKNYRDNGRRYIYPYIGDVKVQKLDEAMVKVWLKKLQDPKYAIKKPLSNKSLKDVFSLLKSVLQSAVEDKIIPDNPCRKIVIRKPTKAKNHRTILDESEIRMLLDILQGAPHEKYYKFAMFFGLREMENLGLTMSDIDFGKKIIHLRYQLRKDFDEEILVGETKHFKMLKDHEQRDIPFGEEIEKLLQQQISEEKEKKQALGSEWPINDLERGDLLFSNGKGSYLSYRTIYDCFKRRVREIGLEHVKIHDLRHVYAMLALKQGNPVSVVAEHLGHSTPDLTLAIYDYVSNEARQRSATNMDIAIKAFQNT